jgi:hypothetical protein
LPAVAAVLSYAVSAFPVAAAGTEISALGETGLVMEDRRANGQTEAAAEASAQQERADEGENLYPGGPRPTAFARRRGGDLVGGGLVGDGGAFDGCVRFGVGHGQLRCLGRSRPAGGILHSDQYA